MEYGVIKFKVRGKAYRWDTIKFLEHIALIGLAVDLVLAAYAYHICR